MASVPQNKAVGGCTPLGVFTITSGTPQKVTSLLNLSDKVFTFSARQLGFSVTKASTGEVYVNYGNYAGLDQNATMLIVQPGTSQSLPIGSTATEGLIDCNQIYLDAATGGATVAVYALDASS